MARNDALERLRQALERELDLHHGQKGEVDRRLGHHEGFLRRKMANGFSIKVTELFGTLDTLDLDPADFMAGTFEILPRPEELLRRQEKPGPPSRSLANIETAALAVEAGLPSDDPPGTGPSRRRATRSRQQLESLVRTGLVNQRNAVRKQRWVRDPASLRCYLELLDGLRFDRAHDAAALAETVAVKLVAGVACPREEQLQLLCHAIGAFASAQRVVGEFATAARALGFALGLAGRHGLIAVRAGLLQRGGYVLRDAGLYDQALVLLDDALVLWAEEGRPGNFGRTMVDRANVIWYQGEFARANRVFKVALAYLSGDRESHRRHRLAAAQGIAYSQLCLGDSDQAELWFKRAMELVDAEDSTSVAKLIWHKGAMFYNRGDYPAAEAAFTNVRRILEVKENAIQGAYVALDLAAALEAQGKTRELKQLAKEMSGLLVFFEDNKLAAAALMRFIRAGLEGRVTERLIAEVGKKLGRTRPLVWARPARN